MTSSSSSSSSGELSSYFNPKTLTKESLSTLLSPLLNIHYIPSEIPTFLSNKSKFQKKYDYIKNYNSKETTNNNNTSTDDDNPHYHELHSSKGFDQANTDCIVSLFHFVLLLLLYYLFFFSYLCSLEYAHFTILTVTYIFEAILSFNL